MKDASGQARKAAYYQAEIAEVTFLFQDNRDAAYTVRELDNILSELGITQLRAVLTTMVEKGDIIKRSATKGGAWGRPPMIYGVDEAAIAKKNREIVLAAKTKKKRKRHTPTAQPAADLPDTEPLRVDLGEPPD
jgi:hypothetical protein